MKKNRLSGVFFFASAFKNTDRPWVPQTSKLEDLVYRKNDFPLVDTEVVRDQMHQQNVHKSIGPGGIQRIIG